MKKKVILTECYATKLVEAEGSVQEPGVLATVRGTFARYNKRNKNDRLYEGEVWRRTLTNPDVQAALKGKRMFGELDHPEDYLDVKIMNTAMCVTKLEMDEATETIQGEFKIMDTPAGQILNTLVRFGSELGVSSRASGDLDEDNRVIPESYEFITFDVVSNPSNVEAFPTLVESTQRKSLKEALLSEIPGATKEKLDLIKRMSSSLDESSASEIINKIEEEETVESDPILELTQKVDSILEILNTYVVPKEPAASEEVPVQEEPVEELPAPEQVTESEVRVKEKIITESSKKRETRVLARRVITESSETSTNDKQTHLIRINKSK